MDFPCGRKKGKKGKNEGRKEERRDKTLEQLCYIKPKVHADGTASSSTLWDPDR
jgi:hypothetical protein